MDEPLSIPERAQGDDNDDKKLALSFLSSKLAEDTTADRAQVIGSNGGLCIGGATRPARQ